MMELQELVELIQEVSKDFWRENPDIRALGCDTRSAIQAQHVAKALIEAGVIIKSDAGTGV